jgi:hypothetical protein
MLGHEQRRCHFATLAGVTSKVASRGRDTGRPLGQQTKGS